METEEDRAIGKLAKPLWTMAVALWVIAVVGIIGAVKVYQMQQDIQHEIEKIPKIKLPKF